MLLRAVGVLAFLAAFAAAAEMFNERVAVLEPFPREVARGKTMKLKGRVKGGFRKPELAIIAPSGKTYLNRDNRIGEHAFTFKVRFGEGPGPYRMEVLAHKTTAIQSAARFTVYYGRKRPPEEKEPPIPKGRKTPRDIHTLLVEKRFLARLNEFRRSVKLDPVGWNEAVAARAREHAVRMAKARRRQHRFGNVGVREMLGRDGAGPGGASGPDRAWTRLTGVRPFDRPAPQPPGPRVRNHVVVFILALDSLEEMFERYFVREAAFRLCALDPYCIEVAVGAARSPRKPAPK
ncbi:MAG: CAP domain-containing protein, partial [Planctomycetota bacterium]